MYVIINGVSSDTIQGLQVLSLPPITKPKMRRQVDTIDGRAGDIITELGYEAYDRTITVLLHHNYDLDAITAFFNTSGEIIFSNEPDKKYYFQLLEKIDYERAVQFKTANITFHVQPYKYPVSETPLTVSTTAWEGTDYDQTPYIFRAVSDSSVEVGNREIVEQITGGTVAWNQQVPNGNFADTTYWAKASDATFSVSNNVGTFKAAARYQSISAQGLSNMVSGHVYMGLIDAQSYTNSNTGFYVRRGSGSSIVQTASATLSTTMDRKAVMLKANDAGFAQFLIQDNNETGWGEIKIKNAMLIDLNQLFGSTIADYIYQQEQSQAGKGVYLFKSLFPKDYYAYNAGELMSVKTSARETVGKNLLPSYTNNGSRNGATWVVNNDKSIVVNGTATALTDIPVIDMSKNFILPVGDYIFSGGASNGGNTNHYIAIREKSTGSDRYVLINNDTPTSFSITEDDEKLSVAIRLYANQTYSDTVWKPMIRFSSATDSAYEPYQKHTYPLSNIELRGIPKLVNNQIQYDGDIYKSDGSVMRRYGIVDLGTLVWTYDSALPRFYSTDLASYVAKPGATIIGNLICARYPASSFSILWSSGTEDIIVISEGGAISVKDTSYTSASAFKTAMSGVYLVYELATPTTETTTPYTETQICDADGTEEFIDTRDVQIPVGHKTKYMQINDPAEITVPNAGNVPSAPTIQLTGSGTVGVYLGNAQTLQVNIPEDGITIDTEEQDATSNGQLANRSVTGDYDSVRLQPGDNDVSFSGDVSAVITNYTRWV